jgi:UDPglucose--hexose-1-phosphate uridylyltransferase
MDVFMPKPSEVIRTFNEKLKTSPQAATEYFYDLSKKSHYIRLDRTSKNMLWQVDTDYGVIDISINLSKPEKDPKAIAAVLNKVENNYPKCFLCIENEGYSGHVSHPGRQNHRIVPLMLQDEDWFLQYSPYAYFNEHSIILKASHENMVITHKTLSRLLDFLDIMPHYFVGSNADLPLVGGSLLTHDHYQCGQNEFAMDRADILGCFPIDGVKVEHLKWPLSVLRVSDKDRLKVELVAKKIFDAWMIYEDQSLDIIAYTGEVRHNTVTPIARYKEGVYELDLVLRNNRMNDDYPTGIFHPHPDVHPVKKENIGLIEVMGLAVLPSRLVEEMTMLTDCIVLGKTLVDKKFENVLIQVEETITSKQYDHVYETVKQVIGEVFVKGLEDSGVYKQTEAGHEGLSRFIKSFVSFK